MGKTMSTTRNQNCDVPWSDLNRDVPWSDLNHDVLYLVMIRLGVVEFVAFSVVCKSWRSVALSNWNKFMASRLPMSIHTSPAPTSLFISPPPYEKTCRLEDTKRRNFKTCYLEDFEGRKFKTIIPNTALRECVGLTCGYLILFGKETNDFWLVNPITRHQLCFPDLPFYTLNYPVIGLRGILVSSPSISGYRWMFVMVKRLTNEIWFSIDGTRAWNRVSSPSPICEIHVFKGKIYTLINRTIDGYQLCELRLDPHPTLVLLETKNFLKLSCDPHFVSSGENLYLVQFISNLYSRHELDIGEMKWVCCETTSEERAFVGCSEQTVVNKPKWWAGLWPKYGKYVDTKNKIWEDHFGSHMLYFPYDCLNVNRIHD